jgi:PhoPQ-activated pathogenicity-related protein
MRLGRIVVLLGVLVWGLLGDTKASGSEPAHSDKTPLDEYIARPDAAYSWKVVNTIRGDGITTFIVDMVSQNWRSTPEVNRTTWRHWLVVVKPDKVQHSTAFVNVGGGKNGSKAPAEASPLLVHFAKTTNTVTAELHMIPNQPLIFNGDGQPRSEDDLIAYCWIKFMDTGDATWLPRLPMVKSVVRAMDTITALLGSAQGENTTVDKFVVLGGSKRGWTTWLTGAVDQRVVALVPAVIDVLNVRACSINHFSSFGFWAAAIEDYDRHKVHERMDTPEYAALLKIVDPYSYRERLTMPKFVLNASGDQYFPPDSSRFYFDDLPGPKYLRYVPNANHSLKDTDAQESVLAFYQAILAGGRLPKFTWKMQKDGSILVRTGDNPSEVNLWQATNPKARDFRLESIGPAYRKSRLQRQADGSFIASVPNPETGWTAFFVELKFPGKADVPFTFTTQVSIVPDALPHSIEEFRRQIKSSENKDR